MYVVFFKVIKQRESLSILFKLIKVTPKVKFKNKLFIIVIFGKIYRDLGDNLTFT